MCCILCAREGIERNQKKLHFFHSFLFHRGTVSQFPSRNRSSNTETHPTSAFKKNCRNTRVDSHSHTHTLKTFIFSRLRKKKREREREVRFIRALSFLLRRKVVSSSKSLVLKIGTLLTFLPFLIKNPPRLTQVTHTQERIDKYTHI